MIGGLEYASLDAAGTAGSVAAKSHTTISIEYGGELFSYIEGGKTLYGYIAPRPGLANFTENGNTYHPGPTIISSDVSFVAVAG